MPRQPQTDAPVRLRGEFLVWFRRVWAGCGLALGAGLTATMAQTGPSFDAQASVVVTNVHQIRLWASQNPQLSCFFHLEGDIWWANSKQGKLVLKDDSGVEELEMNLPGKFPEPGQRVRLDGSGTITPAGAGFRIGAMGPVVDNDGVHGMIEKSGSMYLPAGPNPIRVEWFNGVEKFGLTVAYQGPGLSRRKIPDAALFRVDPASGASNRVSGLDYVCVEATDELVPDFNASAPLKSGTVSNFDLQVMARPEHVGICFTGFLQIPQDGLYTFFLTSDDGSRLFIGQPSLQLKVIGQSTPPNPQPLLVGQILRRQEAGQWGEVEGKVTFASEQPDGLELELSTETGRTRVEIANPAGLVPAHLLNHRIRAAGFCQSAYASDGREVLGLSLVPDGRGITLLEPPSAVAECRRTSLVGQCRRSPSLETRRGAARLPRQNPRRHHLRPPGTSGLHHPGFHARDLCR